MDKAKPFNIPKREVWEAYKRVRANQGAAGVDGQSIAEFEQDLSDNLYKLWNRLSSGSYFPRPVRRVPVPPEPHGFMANSDATLEQNIFYLPKRQWIADVHHNHEADHLGRAVEITEWIAHCRRQRNLARTLKPIYSDNAGIFVRDRSQSFAKTGFPLATSSRAADMR